MKTTTKFLTSILLLSCTLSLTTACNSDKKSSSGDPTPSVSTNEVINQSVEEMETLMGIESDGGVQSTAFVAPNYDVEYAHERLSVLNGSGLALYFTEYLANPSYGFADDTVYKDTMTVQSTTVNFYARKTAVEGGVHVSLEMHQTQGTSENVSPIQIYFAYDYEAKKPSQTTIVSVTENGSIYNVSLAQFDYSEAIAYSYNFQTSAANAADVKTALTEKNFDFEKLISCDVSRYVFAKLDPSKNTIESYGYITDGTDESTATQADVSALYTAIYAQVKDACVPVALLDSATAVEKVYYQAMWTYGADRASKIK